MDVYHIFANHTEDTDAHTFVQKMSVFLDEMVALGRMESYRIMRMKLGFRSMDLPEFRIDMEFESMQQLDDAMTITVADKGVDQVHVGFNQYVDTDSIQHFLYRDFPDDLNKPKLTETPKQFTIKEIVEATKRVDPEIWK